LADPLRDCGYFAPKNEKKCLNLLFLHRHSSEDNGFKKMFLEPQNHKIFLEDTFFGYLHFL
jgi:hypothetical protein